MITLRIDATKCKLRNERIKLPRYSSKRLEDTQSWREATEMEVEVIATPNVTALLGYADNIHRTTEFNVTKHTGTILSNGIAIFEGEATVLGVERDKDEVYYRIRLRAQGHDWAHNIAHTRLRNSGIDETIPMTLSGIENTWSNDRVVRMLPLRYDSYPEPEESGLYSTQRVIMPHDYYPFISISAMVKKMIRDSGYELHSNFFNSPEVKKLMMSGAYKNVDTSHLKSTMGFKALRSYSSTTAAGEDGRVYAWSPIIASNIGTIIDTIDPTTECEEGVSMQGAYANGGCFALNNGRPTYTPKREISVAFDMHIHYTTEYKLTSSRYLKGFTKIHLGNGCNMEVTLHNPFIDRRKEVKGGQQYKLFIFDYDPTCSYLLSNYGNVDSAISTLSFSDGFSGTTSLKVKRAGGNVYANYSGDWALYDGYVSESGNREIIIDVRTPFERLSPSNPKRFNDIYFGGAIMGQQMTLHAGCSVTPVFGGIVGYGQEAKFTDVANIDISQGELLNAIAHLFNLRFYSHEPTKSLYIEPYDDFYHGDEVDWQSKQIGTHELITERVAESYQRTVLGYQPSDGATARYTNGEEHELGTWDCHVENYATKRSTESLINPLFRPVVSFTGASATAPSALILTTGDRDTAVKGDSVEPRIVLYHGIEPLPSGEYWPSPNGHTGYPLATFHSPEHNATLCFNDRDGCAGLHHYYDTELNERATRQRLECDIHITPIEYASLFVPNHSGATIRSNFRLKAGGQSSLFRLESIESYDTTNNIARCVFVRRLTD